MPSSVPRLGAALALALCVLAGCRTVPPPFPSPPPWDVRRLQLQGYERFELGGRVAVASGREGFNANLHWRQRGAHAQLTLEGPLGTAAVQVSATNDELDIVTAHGEHLANDAAHEELRRRLGFDPPLTGLRYWILGVPDPARPATESIDARQQRLTTLAQDGWHIDYLEYVLVEGEWLPARLTLVRDAVRVRLLVDDWQT